jgi:hypothetical protein
MVAPVAHIEIHAAQRLVSVANRSKVRDIKERGSRLSAPRPHEKDAMTAESSDLSPSTCFDEIQRFGVRHLATSDSGTSRKYGFPCSCGECLGLPRSCL